MNTDFIEAVILWNHKKSFKNFIRLYKKGFEKHSIMFYWPIWKVWRIFKNTYLNNRYKEIEKFYSKDISWI